MYYMIIAVMATIHINSSTGEEYKDVKTLFIWVKGSIRYAARGWTIWTGEKIKNDYIY